MEVDAYLLCEALLIRPSDREAVMGGHLRHASLASWDRAKIRRITLLRMELPWSRPWFCRATRGSSTIPAKTYSNGE